MPVTPKTLRAVEKSQVDIQARRVAMHHDRPKESGFGQGVSLGPGKWRYVCGEWHKIEEAPPLRSGKSDSHNMVSNSTGCTRSQVGDFNKTFGHMGVKFQPDGKAVYKDVQAQERVLAARGYVNYDSNRSGKNT